MLTFFNRILRIGVEEEMIESQKRPIILSNIVSVIFISVRLILLIWIPGNHNLQAVRNGVIMMLFFSVPLALNYFKYYTTSKIWISWLPPILITMNMILDMKEMTHVTAAKYDGIRFYLIAFGCLPYLLFGMRNWITLIFAIAPSFLLLIFCDTIMNFFKVGYGQIGIPDSGYYLTPLRAFLSYSVISGSCFALKILIEISEEKTQELIRQLNEKNKEIERKSQEDLSILNKELEQNLEELKEREFTLNQSQRIANIGSWEFKMEGGSVFLSDEMYNIFGFDKGIDIKSIGIQNVLHGTDAIIFTEANDNLLKNGIPYNLTLRATTPLGHKKWVRTNAYPIESEKKIVGIRGICYDITGFKEAELLLKESEHKYRSLFEQAFEPIVITDLKGNIIDVNASFCNMVGYRRFEILQRSVESFILEEDLNNNPIQYSILGQGDHLLNERKIVRNDGKILEGEVSAKKFGKNSLMAVIRDVTEMRKAQRMVLESEARFRSAFEFSAIGMALVSPQGKFLKVNEKICRISGYEQSEMLNLSFQQITHKDDVEADSALFNRTLNGEFNSFTKEKRYVHKNGSIVWINLTVSLVRGQRDEPLYFVSQVEDITERKKSELELIEAETKFRTLVEKSLVGVYIMQNDGYKYVNQSFADIFGYTLSEITNGINVDALVHPEDHGLFEENIRARMSLEKDSVHYELRGIRKDGSTMWLEAFGSRIPYHGEDAIIGTVIDITERKRFEHDIRESEERYRILVENAEEALVLFDLNTQKFVDVSTSATVLFKLTKEELLNIGPVDVSPEFQPSGEPSKDLAPKLIMESVEKGGTSFQWTHCDSSGKLIPCEITLVKLPSGDSQLIRGSIVDISERIIKEQELAEAQKVISGLKLMALRSVMSPHFIFNVLNSIQYFIAKNDRLNAINYLSTFSKLVRSVLTHSVNNKIKLSDEVEILKNYIELELTRFENKFDYTITIDPDIDPDSIEIPSLLIQPYVENAILHGLYNKQNRGKLDIQVYEENDIVYFEIKDNGIGRKAAQELKTINFPMHKSMGIKLTEERLRLINEGRKVSFEIKDLTDGDEPSGTQVTIGVLL